MQNDELNLGSIYFCIIMKGSGFFSDCKMEPVKKPMIKLFLNQQKHQEFVGLTTGGEPWRFSSKTIMLALAILINIILPIPKPSNK